MHQVSSQPHPSRVSATTDHSVRHALAQATHADHVALHTHPTIGRLTAPDLTMAEYGFILGGFRDIFAAAEGRRQALQVWPQFSLAEHCAALNRDTGRLHQERGADFTCLTTPQMMLGLLYALHGAQFGQSVIFRSLQIALPQGPHHYFSRGTDAERWRDMIRCLEEQGTMPEAFEEIAHGARTAFHAIGRACSLN